MIDTYKLESKLIVALEVLTDLKHVLKEEDGLDLNVSKKAFLPKDISQEGVLDVVWSIITSTPTLTDLTGDISFVSFVPECFLGIGMTIGTDACVRKFVAKTCRVIIDDVGKLDTIQDDFIHYELLRFCQTTQLQIVTLTFCSVIDAFCNRNTLIAKLQTHS